MINSIGTPALWVGFLALVATFLALDLGIFHKRDQAISIRNALGWTAVWVAVSLAFCGLVAWQFGGRHAAEFLTGYLIEKSLSVDNLFVFMVVFSTFGIPAALQHRVLFWGILGALFLRAAMILAGTALLTRFHWLILVFGGFLLFTGIKILFFQKEDAVPHPERTWAFRVLQQVFPATTRYDGHRFFVEEGGQRLATPLFLALLLIEVSDVVFALDSIPAIFGVTLDPFIVFTSNIFAILGLRSLYFAIAGMMDKFVHLQHGLALVLVFIGGKMALGPWVDIDQWESLGVVVVILSGAVGLSLWRNRRGKAR